MLKVEWPKVYYSKNGWMFSCVLDGKLIERPVSEYDAMGLAESVLAASKAKARPQELNDWTSGLLANLPFRHDPIVQPHAFIDRTPFEGKPSALAE